MTITQARKIARDESSIYRQGPSWVLSTWSEEHKSHETSGELTFFIARKQLKEWRERRAATLTAQAS